MVELLVHLVITAALLLLIARVVRGIEVSGWGSAFLAALALGLVNGIVRPLMVILTIPMTILTLGLFLFVVNALMFWLAAALAPGFRVRGFLAALLGSLLLTVLNVLVAAAFDVG